MADRRQALQRVRALNPKANEVASPLFQRIDFFDPHDKLQVKYEMLRAHEVDGVSVSRAAEQFGYTRQAFYQVKRAFQERGLAGLLDRKRGRKGPVKCTPEVVAFLVREKQGEPDLSGRELAERLRKHKGVEVHRRTVEKVVAQMGAARRKKKPRDAE
ncbi:helix-turn-helix domain containing protein [bacterium]|nr:helix-turn-helix domain containing protein [bacterium]